MTLFVLLLLLALILVSVNAFSARLARASRVRASSASSASSSSSSYSRLFAEEKDTSPGKRRVIKYDNLGDPVYEGEGTSNEGGGLNVLG